MFLEKLSDNPKTEFLKKFTTVSLILFILFTAAVFVSDYKLKITTGYDILNFEQAWTPERVLIIFSAWGPETIQKVIYYHYIDYLYIIFYVLPGTATLLVLTRRLGKKIQKIGSYMIFTFIIGGIFDSLENVNLLLMLFNKNNIIPLYPFLASFFSTFKIIFLAAGLIFISIEIILLRTEKKRAISS